MQFLTETPFIIGIIVTVLGLFIAFSMMKPNKGELTGIKDWTTREKWSGTTVTTTLTSWSQTDTKYGNDFFYNFTFPMAVDGKEKQYVAKGLVRPNDIHKLKKGMNVVVKYSNDRPPKVAVMNVIFES